MPGIFATLPFFIGGDSVTYGYGKLLVGGRISSFLATRVIYDISAGGNFPTPPAPFATHGGVSFGPGFLDTVPAFFALSPQDQLAAIIAQLQALIDGGTLTQIKVMR